MKALDIETRSLVPDHPEYALQPWRVQTGEAEITLIAVGDGCRVDFEPLDRLRESFKLTELSATMVCWNALFDVSFLYAAGCNVGKWRWVDAMLLCKWAENCQDNDQMGYSLAKCAKRWLPDWEYLDQFLKLKATEADPAYDKYWQVRCKLDVMATYLIAERALKKLTPQQRKSAMIEAGNIVPNAKAYVKGIPTNSKYYSDPIPALQKEMAEIECRLGVANPATGDAVYGGKGWLPSKILRSPKQLADTLYNKWGLPCKHTTDKGAPATDKTALTYLADRDDKALEILRWRHLNTRLTKFCQSPGKAAKYLGSSHLHPEPKIFSTYTGRYTYGSKSGKEMISMALHQIPRGPEVRRMVEAPEGKMLVEFDASGQEARLLAEIGNIYSMLEVFKEGKKIHAVMGAAIGGIPYDEFMKRYKAGEPSYAGPEGLYYCGKFCIAEGQLVDTNRGPIAIENVTVDDLVWDGVEYVRHDGVVCNGVKEVIERDGIVATPDHKVLTVLGWRELHEVKRGGIVRSDPPKQREEVRGVVDIGESLLQTQGPKAKKAVRSVLSLPMQVWRRVVRYKRKHTPEQVNTMQAMRSQFRDSGSVLCQTIPCDGRSMYQPQQPSISQLWGAWCHGEVQGCEAILRIHEADIPRSDYSGFKGTRDRPTQQQPRVRDREYPTGNETREPAQHTPQSNSKLPWPRCAYKRLVASVKTRLSRLHIFASMDLDISKQRKNRRRDFRAGSTAEVPGRQVRVYDIINAGPRHRFTVQGKIVSNCNLSMQYRVGAAKQRVMARVQYGLQKELTTIQRWRAAYHHAYPEVKKYWQQAASKAKMNGYAETLAGRRYYIDKWHGEHAYKSEQSAINFPIQGSGGDMKNLAITTLHRKFPELEFAWDLHDGVYTWADRSKAGIECAMEAREALNNLDYEDAWGWKPRIPIPWDLSIGTNWGSMKEV